MHTHYHIADNTYISLYICHTLFVRCGLEVRDEGVYDVGHDGVQAGAGG